MFVQSEVKLPPLVPGTPRGSPTAIAELCAAFAPGADARLPLRAQARGLFGAARGFALAQLSLASRRPLVCIVADEEAAEALEKDLRFFAGPPSAQGPRVLRLPGEELLPYDGLTPDRLIAQQRLSALFHLHLGDLPGDGVRAIVLSLRALARRAIPRGVLDARSLILSREMEQDRDELAARLVAAGYSRSPLCEDPGTFAVRGGVFDVWSPLATQPARLEFFGDLIETIKLFDPLSQRSGESLSELALCPAREIVLDEAGRKAAIGAIRAAADLADMPTRSVRTRIDELQDKGADDALFAASLAPLLPGFFESGLAPITDYLPPDAIFVLDDPLELERRWSDSWSELQGSFTSAREKGELALPPEQHYLHEREVRLAIEPRAQLFLSGLALASPAARHQFVEDLDAPVFEPRAPMPPAESDGAGNLAPALRALRSSEANDEVALHAGDDETRGEAQLAFALEPTADLRAEIAGHHGESGALEPLVQRLNSLREHGVVAYIACHSTAQAERLRRLLLDRRLMALIGEPPDPLAIRKSGLAAGSDNPEALGAVLFDASVHAHLAVGELSEGFIDPNARLAVFSDEDVFGPRARVRTAVRRPKTFGSEGADFRDLKNGDSVVHVEHGIARYEGLTRLSVRGHAADFILLQFAGKDKLYLPVGRLRQMQKYVGGDPATASLDSLKGRRSSRSARQRVKEELLKMAARAARALRRAQGAPRLRLHRRPTRCTGSSRRTSSSRRRPTSRRRSTTCSPTCRRGEPMDRLVCGDVGYGKTEVAVRAAFKAVEDEQAGGGAGAHDRARRAALQDLREALQGLSGHGGGGLALPHAKEIAAISSSARRRARSTSSSAPTGCSQHDVAFKDLGLVVVDEEQRFGVKHKEALKKLRTDGRCADPDGDADPAHAAHGDGRRARPVDHRHAARRTGGHPHLRAASSTSMIAEAIERELARGGQVFFVHNRVRVHRRHARTCRSWCPRQDRASRHGQMAEGSSKR